MSRWNRQFDDTAEAVLARGPDSVVATLDHDEPPVMYLREVNSRVLRMLAKWRHRIAAAYLYFPDDLRGIELVNAPSIWVISDKSIVPARFELSDDVTELRLLGNAAAGPLEFPSNSKVTALTVDWEVLAAGKPSVSLQIKRLVVTEFGADDLNWLSDYPALEELALYGASSLETISFDGVAAPLRKLEIAGARRLRDLPGIHAKATTLTELRLEGCTSLSSLDFLTALPNLELLSLSDCGEIETAAPIAGLPRLRELHVTGTTKFTSPDVSAIARTPLHRLFVANRRHYQPKLRNIEAEGS